MSEVFQYINRMGTSYYLQKKVGKGGKPKYSFARQLTGTGVEQLPEGCEVREHPETGQVVIRRVKPSSILPLEKTLLEKTIQDQTDGLLFIVDVDGRSLVVYTSDMVRSEAEARVSLLRQFAPLNQDTARQMAADIVANASYTKMMRFTLTNPKSRLFNVDRWCFSGSIDDWYFIEGDQPLSVLAEKYVHHLGQDSFFDLM